MSVQIRKQDGNVEIWIGTNKIIITIDEAKNLAKQILNLTYGRNIT